ncbi:dTDP-4-dehydrorhamnose 3,5-epimerase family protein [Oceanirhabdus sp. W0125-5]|uniref:dTDP-4-dehydrorhamnose 3,5-epimerase family protein n=1 Tax=Oceanirhabdus sp. W0125-5 TaxID=2999116 RepID=UPI0022F2D0F0|nr:dTDP-4-dehydrorhamnose 3,5-epimerase family protein [Oceanirhabdus sp. W0125-5]WBW96646.1 dTDP-4-dehydrorhamnose 3,5-epimerase family protein [Oceanirhabdus sp. W0125-5]
MIDGVIIKNLKRISDDRGTILKMQESCDSEFKGFGEIYFSTIYPGVVKGWHLHEKAILNYAVVKGMIKLVLFDNREGSKTKGELMEIYIGDKNYCLVQIPPKVWNGFKCVGNEEAIVADLITVIHKNDVMKRMNPDNCFIDYDWSLKNR